MSEIEKMMQNAGIKSFKTCEFCTQRSVDCLKENISNITCGFSSDIYPPFTAEKQIELIKLLGNVRDYTVEIDKFKGVYYVGCRSAGSNDKLWGSSNVFEDALAELINSLWQDLTESEQNEIREILKG